MREQFNKMNNISFYGMEIELMITVNYTDFGLTGEYDNSKSPSW